MKSNMRVVNLHGKKDGRISDVSELTPCGLAALPSLELEGEQNNEANTGKSPYRNERRSCDVRFGYRLGRQRPQSNVHHGRRAPLRRELRKMLKGMWKEETSTRTKKRSWTLRLSRSLGSANSGRRQPGLDGGQN